MARKVLFDTSRYISLRMAVWIALVALVVCVLVGLKYTTFSGDLLSAKKPKYWPSPPYSRYLGNCIKEHNECLFRRNSDILVATEAYSKCVTGAESGLDICINKNGPGKEEVNKCEMDSAVVVRNCTEALAVEVSECAPVMFDCIQKTNDVPGVVSAPEVVPSGGETAD